MTTDIPREVYAGRESKEWYTPPEIADLARQLMGGIDLDPASIEEAQQTIRAERYYTAADDGLAQPWRGRVFLNPPYGDAIRLFVDRLLAAYESGDVSEAIAVLPARPDTRWFQPLYRYPLCFWRGRVKFNRPGKQKASSAPFPTVILYLGAQVERFCTLFGEYGQIQMPQALTPMTTDQTLTILDAAPLATALDAASVYAEQSRSAATRRAYQSDWADFTAWCAEKHAAPLPALPATVAAYIAELARAGRKPATIQRRLASISQAHQMRGHPSPAAHEAVRSVLKGIRRAHGSAQHQATAATIAIIRRMVDALPEGLAGTRDRALILVGFAGAFRRSELVGLEIRDLDFRDSGLVVTLRRSKTDQEGEGREIGIPYGSTPTTCPIRALRGWLAAACISSGPIFRGVNKGGQVAASALSDRAVALIVKRSAERAGLDPALFSGHSLRAGLATSAAERGASYHSIKQQTGHKSDRVLQRYIRRADLFRDNAASVVGL